MAINFYLCKSKQRVLKHQQLALLVLMMIMPGLLMAAVKKVTFVNAKNATHFFAAPVITSNGGGLTAKVSVPENISTSTVITTVTGSPTAGLTFSLNGGADASAFNLSGTGVLTFKVPPNAEAPTDAGADNTYQVIVKISNANGLDEQLITVTVMDVDEAAPVISSNGGSLIVNLQLPEGNTAVTKIIASDADRTAVLTYSLIGADANKFHIAGTGVLTFATAPDYELPIDNGANNTYTVTVDVSGGTLASTQTFNINVTNVNDNVPIITSNGGALTVKLSIPENTTKVTTVKAKDADGDQLFYAVVGGTDKAKFEINAATGVLSFLVAPDFENPTDASKVNIYQVIVEASDGAKSANQIITVNILDVNEQPSDIQLTTTAIFENNLPGALVSTITSTDPDVGAAFTYALVSGAGSTNNTTFAIVGKELRAKTALDYETKSTNAVRLRTTDNGGLFYEKPLVITVKDVNEAPTLNTISDLIVCDNTNLQTVNLTGITPGPETAQKIQQTITTTSQFFDKLSVLNGLITYQLKPNVSGNAGITVTITDDGGTANGGKDSFSQTFKIVVNTTPVLKFTNLADICVYSAPVLLTEAGETSGLTGTGTYSGVGVTADGHFDPSITGAGSRTISYTFITPQGCQSTIQQTINIIAVPTLFLPQAELTVLQDGQTTLNVQASGIVANYYKWTPNKGLDHDDVLNPIASPDITTVYKLTVYTEALCPVSTNITVKVIPPQVFTAFTPNGDGINDTWSLNYLETYPDASIVLYNRSGVKVYTVRAGMPWDGNIFGAAAPVGTYYYLVQYARLRRKIAGSVTLIR